MNDKLERMMIMYLAYIFVGGFVLYLIIATAVRIGVKEAIIELKKDGII